MNIREYREEDLPAMTEIWNGVVREGNAFPQEDELSFTEAKEFFRGQSFCGVAEDGGQICGLYILHPNNVGRCGHLCNASYAVSSGKRGLHIGEQLVAHCLGEAKKLGFQVLQFNAVVCTNEAALRLYKRMGFTQLGTVPNGFRLKDGSYTDIIPHYICLS